MAKRYTLREAVALLDKLENDLLAAHRKMVTLAVRQGEILHALKNSGKVKDWQDAAKKTKRSLSWVRNRERLYRLRGIIA
jgi:hypothetical protein